VLGPLENDERTGRLDPLDRLIHREFARRTAPPLIEIGDTGVVIEIVGPLGGGIARELDQPGQLEQRMARELVTQHEVPLVEVFAKGIRIEV